MICTGVPTDPTFLDQYNQVWQENEEDREAEYDGWFSKKNFVIIMWQIYSPSPPLNPPFVEPQYYPTPPPLSRYSDWMFLIWEDFCDYDAHCVASLRWVVHRGVSNPSAKNVAKIVSDIDTAERDPIWRMYPGAEYELLNEEEPDNSDHNSDYFNALVGNPNGWGIALMLQQRKSDFLSRVINRVNVFGSDDDDILCMQWRIGPANEND